MKKCKKCDSMFMDEFDLAKKNIEALPKLLENEGSSLSFEQKSAIKATLNRSYEIF